MQLHSWPSYRCGTATELMPLCAALGQNCQNFGTKKLNLITRKQNCIVLEKKAEVDRVIFSILSRLWTLKKAGRRKSRPDGNVSELLIKRANRSHWRPSGPVIANPKNRPSSFCSNLYFLWFVALVLFNDTRSF